MRKVILRFLKTYMMVLVIPILFSFVIYAGLCPCINHFQTNAPVAEWHT